MSVRCWPEGDLSQFDCDEEIPDSDFETMERYGWGWVWAHDSASASGTGPFCACPEHRSDCTEEEREVALRRLAQAKAALNKGEPT